MGNEFVRTIIQFASEILVDSGSKFRGIHVVGKIDSSLIDLSNLYF